MDGGLLFRILTPLKDVASFRCDAVNLVEKDNAEGKGGSIGILRGHLPAVIALEENSPVTVSTKGKTVFAATVRSGFARVDQGSVTILTPSANVTLEE